MEYVCRVGTPTGEVVEQTFTAPDEVSLRSELEQKGYYLFSVRRGMGLKSLGLRQEKIHPDLLLLFGQELAALLKAGLPLLQGLDIMLERQRDPVFRRSLTTVREKVKTGVALSEAFRAEGDLYPAMLSASIVAGERSGNLEGVLRRFVQYMRLNQQLKKKAISAAIYPLMIVCMMVGMTGVLMVFVIPQFESFFAGLDAELPLPTRILMAVANAMKANLLWIVLVVAGAWAFFASWLPPPRLQGGDRPLAPARALPREPDADVRDQPARAHAVRAPHRRPPAGERDGRGRQLGGQPGHGGGGHRRHPPHPRGQEPDHRARVHRHARQPRPGDGEGRASRRAPSATC